MATYITQISIVRIVEVVVLRVAMMMTKMVLLLQMIEATVG